MKKLIDLKDTLLKGCKDPKYSPFTLRATSRCSFDIYYMGEKHGEMSNVGAYQVQTIVDGLNLAFKTGMYTALLIALKEIEQDNRLDEAMKKLKASEERNKFEGLSPDATIEIKFDGAYPNLCSGHLIVIINGESIRFPSYCLSSGGKAWTNDDYTGGTTGPWTIREWPEGFPENMKQAVTNAVNERVPHGCCGGCV